MPRFYKFKINYRVYPTEIQYTHLCSFWRQHQIKIIQKDNKYQEGRSSNEKHYINSNYNKMNPNNTLSFPFPHQILKKQKQINKVED